MGTETEIILDIPYKLPVNATILNIQSAGEEKVLVFINAGWSDDIYPDAKLRRDRTARALRKLGYGVESKTWNFTDLARCLRYQLKATHPEWEFFSMGGWRKKE